VFDDRRRERDLGGAPASRKRAEISRLRELGMSYAHISRKLGLSKATVAYHARRLGIPADDRFARRYDWAVIQHAYDTGLSARQCAARFGFNLASWHAAMKRGDIVVRPQATPVEELFVAGRRRSRNHLKWRLLRAGLKENRCEDCGLTEWRGKSLSMALHHVNGDGHDNRLENLRFLCPNCHAQTPNYGGRNGHRRSSDESGAKPPGAKAA
jgi:DNA-binding transcriptional ArsR family regulator